MRALVLLACLLVSCTARADHTKDAIDVEVVNGVESAHELLARKHIYFI